MINFSVMTCWRTTFLETDEELGTTASMGLKSGARAVDGEQQLLGAKQYLRKRESIKDITDIEDKNGLFPNIEFVF
ncbi:MAG TPA: hypothetical protein DCL41_06280 [Bdellovibrionales bacterium]|nr:hypothetical protein [Pseudobdellovibrionaceae bacterium]HAG91457.1 hypothetical protein [Bdellovibrionales bacterium]|tara:strand:- start:1311 stop:1538 length:228 start_codon:yes stop_codon:yes gene_type:complete